jgi:hypothetical protein
MSYDVTAPLRRAVERQRVSVDAVTEASHAIAAETAQDAKRRDAEAALTPRER